MPAQKPKIVANIMANSSIKIRILKESFNFKYFSLKLMLIHHKPWQDILLQSLKQVQA